MAPSVGCSATRTARVPLSTLQLDALLVGFYYFLKGGKYLVGFSQHHLAVSVGPALPVLGGRLDPLSSTGDPMAGGF